MMRRFFIFTALMALFIPAVPASALPTELLRNASYQGIYDEPVLLNDGVYAGEPFVEGGASRPSVTLLEALTASGDLNGDGVEDAAVVLLEDSGGSGTFSYLAAVLMQGEEPINQATLLLGDRVSIKSIAIEKGQVLVDFIEQNEKVQKSYQFSFVESATENLGALSVSDLEGVNWTLTGLISGEELVVDTEITAIFADAKIGGSSGCNHYSAAVTDRGEGKIEVGPSMGTRKACPEAVMKQENAFLAALGTATQFNFSGGQLLLTHENGVLLFTPLPDGSEDVGISSLKELEASAWVLTELEPDRTLVPGSTITVEFSDGKISGSNGCNKYSAEIIEKGPGMLSVGMAMGTMMACPEAIMDQENTFMAKLVSVTGARLSEGRLELLHENGKLIFTAQPAAE